MDFREDEEQRLIRESIRKLCENFPDDYWEQHDREGKFPNEFFEEMASAGWIGIASMTPPDAKTSAFQRESTYFR